MSLLLPHFRSKILCLPIVKISARVRISHTFSERIEMDVRTIVEARPNRLYQRCSPNLTRSYQESIQALLALESNSSVITSSINMSTAELRRKVTSAEVFWKKLGIHLEELHRLNIIHIAGTKGKGSTCAYIENILRKKGYKTGLFTSPHLITVRERIKINGEPLSTDVFAKYFWEVYEKIVDTNSDIPGFFMFMTLMGFHVFLKERVDVLILETGIGGEFDCTNIVPKPTVVGITSLGMDHVSILGDSLKSIAWHKAGILKHGCPAVTVPQHSIAMEVIKQRACEKTCPIFLSQSLSIMDKIKLGVEGDVQKINASLAIQITRLWEERVKGKLDERIFLNIPSITEEEIVALQETKWPGRCQLIKTDKINFYLDGAHTLESIENSLKWFSSKIRQQFLTSRQVTKVVLFGSTGLRQYEPLLERISQDDFDLAVFSPICIDKTGKYEEMQDWRTDHATLLKRAIETRSLWEEINSSEKMSKIPSVQFENLLDSIHYLFNLKNTPSHSCNISEENKIHVLVTGSLLLVGKILNILKLKLLD